MWRPVAVCGLQFVADNSGALYWPEQQALVVADLPLPGPRHGTTGANGADGGFRRALARLAEVMDRYEPAAVIVLADGLDADAAAAGLAAEEVQILRILQEQREWIWLTGANATQPWPPQLGGSIGAELRIAGITLRPLPTPGWATHEIAAGMRPVAHLSMYGYSLRRACFVGNRQRLVMPAFGGGTAGKNVLDEAFRPLFGTGGMAVWMLGEEGLYPVATRLLAAD